jgi:hypothetical protein
MKKLIFLQFLFVSFAINAQNSFTRVINNDSSDLAYSFHQASNGDYFILGGTNSFGQGKEDIQIIKTNGLGDIQWSYTYGTSGTDIGYKIKPLLDGGFVVAGYSDGLGNGSDDALVFKINSSGALQWARSLSRPGEEKAFDVAQASDGNIYFTGYSNIDSTVENNIIVGRITNTGTVSWIKSYGEQGDDKGYGIAIDNSGQLAIIGSTANDSVNVGDTGDVDMQFLLLNSGGNIVTAKNFGTTADDIGKAITVTNDYKYIVAGITQFGSITEYDVFSAEIDTNYNISNGGWYGLPGNDGVSRILRDGSSLILGITTENVATGGNAMFVEVSSGVPINSSVIGGFDEDATAFTEVSNTGNLGYSILSSGKSNGNTNTHDLVLARLNDMGLTNCIDNIETLIAGSMSFSSGKFEKNYSNESGSNVSLTRASNTNSDSTLCCRLDIDLPNDTVVICAGESVNIGVPSLSGVNYRWSSSNGNFSASTSNPRVSPTTNTSYKVVISADASLNCTADSAEIYVRVNSRQTVAPIRDTFFCENESVQISGPQNMLFYTWTGQNTLLNGRRVTVSSPDTFTLRMGDANTCIYTDTIVVEEKDLPSFNLGPDTTICENLNITLTGPAGMVDYIWNGVSTNNQTLTTNLSQIHTLKVEDTYGCTFEDQIRVLTNPSSSFSLGQDDSFCEGEEYTIFGPGFLVDFKWNDTASSSLSLTVNEGGTYWLEAYNSFNCPAFDTITLTEIPAPRFTLGQDTSICEGESLTLRGPADMDTYLWFNGSSDPTFSVSAQGLYFLTVTDENSCSFTDSVNIGVNQNPKPFLGNDTTILTGNTLNLTPGNSFATYNWSTGESSPSINVTTSGTYWVRVVDNNGCEGTDTIIVQVSASVQYIDGSKFIVYPNPVSEKLIIETEGNMVGSSIELYNASGAVVLQTTAKSNREELNVSELSKGIYWLKTTSNNKTLTFRVVVAR